VSPISHDSFRVPHFPPSTAIHRTGASFSPK